MDANFWHQRWESNDIAFHEKNGNPLLAKHFHHLKVPAHGRVFVPLCGKTRDIHWLLHQGYRVAGAELSALAVRQLFSDLQIEPTVINIGPLQLYQAENIDLFVGNLFDLTKERLGTVDAVYDRAALVALPEDLRPRYAAHLRNLAGHAPQLLICFEYDQAQMEGPPFSIDEAEVNRLYGESYELRLLESLEVPGKLKGKCAALENAWLLNDGENQDGVH